VSCGELLCGCSVLQRVLQRVLQYVAACCSEEQCVAVWCRVVQCVCCSMSRTVILVHTKDNAFDTISFVSVASGHYGVATISRLLKTTGLFLQKSPIKETISCKRNL